MQHSFILKSIKDSTTVTFYGLKTDKKTHASMYNVKIEGPSFYALTRSIFTSDGKEPDQFMKDMAASGTGWKGEKAMKSIHGELTLSAVYDHLKGVLVNVNLRDSSQSWELRCAIYVDPTLLGDLAEKAEDFFQAKKGN